MPSGTVILNDNHSNKLRMDAIQKKIQKVNAGGGNIAITDGYNNPGTPKAKKSLYDSEFIKKYIIEKNLVDENKKRRIEDFMPDSPIKSPNIGLNKLNLVG